MNISHGEICARRICAAFLAGLVCCALTFAMHPSAHAGSLNTSVKLQVVDYEGPIWLDYEFVGTDSHGLPSLEIYEKWHGRDQGPRYWADVEVKVTVRHKQPRYGHDYGDLGDSFKSFYEDMVNKYFPWRNGGSGNDHEEVDPNYGVDPPYTPEDVVVGIDKFAKNKTPTHWYDFLMVLGTGLGDDFEPSHGQDGLYFVADPMPKELKHFYKNPPESGGPESDYLHWFADGENYPGQGYKDRSAFWFGINVPADLFYPDQHDSSYWHARFTIRQHTGIPEPTSIALGLLGATALLARRRSRQA